MAGSGRMNLKSLWHGLADTGRLMVGVPSYRAYCAHMAEAHPNRPVLSATAFFRDRQQARYGGRGGGRCC